MGNVQPALFPADRYRTFTVLGFRDLMVSAAAQDLFLINDGAGDIFGQPKADAAARAGIYKAVHGPRVKGIFAIHKFRMQDHIPLLGRTLCHQIGQALPVPQVFCPDDSRCRHSRGQIVHTGVLAL